MAGRPLGDRDRYETELTERFRERRLVGAVRLARQEFLQPRLRMPDRRRVEPGRALNKFRDGVEIAPPTDSKVSLHAALRIRDGCGSAFATVEFGALTPS